MASSPSTKKMRDIATCPICMNLMTHPVSIKCGHNFCQLCIVEFFNRVRLLNPSMTKLDCPLCRGQFDKNSFRPNKELENMIEVIKEMEETDQEILCEEHGEKLHLFCEDEGQLICWRCERSEHQGHATALVEDVYKGYKEQLQKAMVNLNKLQEECLNHKVFMTMQMNDWKEEINIKRQKIKADFKNLRNFLHEEEKSYMWKLENEEEQMLKRMKKSEAELQQKSSELQSHILELEAKCQGSVQNMLQGVKETLVRSSAVKLEEPENFSLEINTMCSVSELYFDVKKKIKSYQVSVTLDPSTAHPDLLLSDDRRQVTRGCSKENVEASPRRFTGFPCVLGCEGFTSGRHYFEVDVGEGTGWDLGVCLKNVQRGTDMKQEPEFGFWSIRLCKQIVALTSPPTPLYLNEQPLVVGIFVDYEMGVVAFYNMTTGSHMFTFPRVSFSDTLFPYFQVYHHSPLFLPPPDE